MSSCKYTFKRIVRHKRSKTFYQYVIRWYGYIRKEESIELLQYIAQHFAMRCCEHTKRQQDNIPRQAQPSTNFSFDIAPHDISNQSIQGKVKAITPHDFTKQYPSSDVVKLKAQAIKQTQTSVLYSNIILKYDYNISYKNNLSSLAVLVSFNLTTATFSFEETRA